MLDAESIRMYSPEELLSVLEKLDAMGLTRQQMKDLEGMTIQQLDDLVNNKNIV